MFTSVTANFKSTILPKCFTQIKNIPGLKLPVALDFKDVSGKLLTQVVLDKDGIATDLSTGVPYKCPSALRDVYVGYNTDTYSFLYYQNQTLRSLGVQP